MLRRSLLALRRWGGFCFPQLAHCLGRQESAVCEFVVAESQTDRQRGQLQAAACSATRLTQRVRDSPRNRAGHVRPDRRQASQSSCIAASRPLDDDVLLSLADDL